MRTAVLLGSRGTKRTIYFEKAARQNGLPFLFLEWVEWRRCGFPGDRELFVKIDPPVWTDGRLSHLNNLAASYQNDLLAIERDSAVSCFLNPPSHLAALLDKNECKQTLTAAGIPVTQSLGTDIRDSGSLLSRMSDMRIFSVFVKPLAGSGAAGVTAFRIQPKTGRMAAYSCALPEPGDSGAQDNAMYAQGTPAHGPHSQGTPAHEARSKETRSLESGLINTKKLRAFTDPAEILPLLDSLLSLGCIVERWYPKADFNGYSYDLRAVWQDGNLDYLLARLSKGPVTNLHLNNHPLDASSLLLPDHVTASIKELCQRACACYPGLNSAGIDILLEKGSLRPRIIEMNGQGDLLYQDIYGNNEIYSHQTRIMKQWLEKEENYE